MPTGYTAVISDRPDVTLEEFALNCARAFGALLVLRDEPADKPIPNDVGFNSTYHKDALLRARARYAELNGMPDDVADDRAAAEFLDQVEARRKSIERADEQQSRYEAMLAKVEAWEPPTPEHQGLKGFMIQQISESIKFDCSTSYYEGMETKRLAGPEWRQREIEKALHDIDHHATKQKEDEERDRQRNEWVRQLRQSLKSDSAES